MIVPLSGFIKVATKPAIVDLPDPELPTRAIVSPAFASKLILCNTSFSASYAKQTSLKLMAPSMFFSDKILLESSDSSSSFISSSVLSNPAKASVS